MRLRARARTGHAAGHGLGDPELERLVTLLEAADRQMLTVAALRDLGLENPAQTVYELQVVGYTIDRVQIPNREGGTSLGYRLRGGPG